MELQYRGELDGATSIGRKFMLIIFAIFGVAIAISLFMGLSGKNR